MLCTWVVLSRASPATPEVKVSAPDFCTVASTVWFSDPSLKPLNKTKTFTEKLNQTKAKLVRKEESQNRPCKWGFPSMHTRSHGFSMILTIAV